MACVDLWEEQLSRRAIDLLMESLSADNERVRQLAANAVTVHLVHQLLAGKNSH